MDLGRCGGLSFQQEEEKRKGLMEYRKWGGKRMKFLGFLSAVSPPVGMCARAGRCG